MFSVGVLIVEMFRIFSTGMERIVTLSDARKGKLPAQFAAEFPRICSIARECLLHDPTLRPSASQLLAKLESLDLTTRTLCWDSNRTAVPRNNIINLPSPAINPFPSPAVSPSGNYSVPEDAFSLAAVAIAAAGQCSTPSSASSPCTQPPAMGILSQPPSGVGDLASPAETCSGPCSGQWCAAAPAPVPDEPAHAARRTLDLAASGAQACCCSVSECAHHRRVAELEGMVRELLSEKDAAEKRVKELETTVQRQAGLAATLLCNPARLVPIAGRLC
jgi:hypothetical protein